MSPWGTGPEVPIREYKTVSFWPAVTLIFMYHRGLCSFTAFLLGPAVLSGFCLDWLVRGLEKQDMVGGLRVGGMWWHCGSWQQLGWLCCIVNVLQRGR